MRKLLFVLVITVLLIFSVRLIYQGFTIGDLEISGIKQIIEKDDIINQKNDNLSVLVSTSYPGKLRNLQSASELLEEKKKDYENQAILLADNKYYGQTEKYKIDYLWTKIGNYAEDNNVDIDLTVTNSTIMELYDINFTVSGKYSDITEFIYAIENDSKLGFKIEDFNMSSGADVVVREYEDENGVKQQVTASGVQATFSCKEIRIDIKQLDGTTTNTEQAPTDATAPTEPTTTDTNTVNTQTAAPTTENTVTNTTTTNTTSNSTTSASPENQVLNNIQQ